MTKKIVFVFLSWFFYFIFFIDDLELNDMILILGVDMNASVSIETYVTCNI
jgi:hypothetical protein